MYQRESERDRERKRRRKKEREMTGRDRKGLTKIKREVKEERREW